MDKTASGREQPMLNVSLTLEDLQTVLFAINFGTAQMRKLTDGFEAADNSLIRDHRRQVERVWEILARYARVAERAQASATSGK